jgi:hypothetical protein
MAQFLIWSFIWLGLYFLTRLFLIGVRWQNQAQFLAANPEKEWLVSGYKLFLILWLPLSVVGSARFFQEAPTETFYLFVAFVPLLGVGLVKSLLEIAAGIGCVYRHRAQEDITIRVTLIRHSLRFLKINDFYFALAKQRVRLLGFVRLVLNAAVLITLLLLF